MIPNPAPSVEYVAGVILAPNNRPNKPLIDYERGGVAMQDPSQGLMVQDWQAWYDPADETVRAKGLTTLAEHALFTQPGITWLALCFDQNMRWQCAYTTSAGQCQFRWYDSLLGDYSIINIGAGIRSPMLTLDDKRPVMSQTSDVILTYIKGTNLIYRMQRDRFATEYIYAGGKTGIIRNFGMSTANRLQWEIR